MSKIRDLINSSRKQHVLLKDSTLWAMLCSCMDTIEDTEEALESFLEIDTNSTDEGRNYLRIYGALQALFVQQEAIENLHEALGISYTEDSSLEKIRHIRIDAAGHPTNRGNKKAFNFINRGTLSRHKFQLMTLYRVNSGSDELDSKHENVNVRDLIATQKGIFVEVLKNVIETLQEEEVEHRKQFVGKKLISAFQHTSYPFQKVLEATLSAKSPHAELVGSHINQILKSIETFKSGLRERDEPDDNIEHVYANLAYALQHIKTYFHAPDETCHVLALPKRSAKHIKTYFHAPDETHVQREDTYIFANFAQRQVAELKEIAREIDERYSQIETL